MAAESAPILILGRAADAEVLLRAIESGAVKKIWPVGMLSPSPADQGQSMRGVAVLGDLDDLERGGRRSCRSRRPVAAHRADAVGVRADSARPKRLLMKAKRLGLTTSRLPSLDEGGEALRLAPVNVEDLLLRPSVKIDYRRLEAFREGQVDRGDRRRRLDRRGNLRPHRHLRRRAAAGDREFRAGAACGAGSAGTASSRAR